MKKLNNAIAVYIFFLAIYFLTLANNFSSAGDGIDYMREFETGTNLFQSNHLLYHLLTYSIYKLFYFLSVVIPDHYIIEGLNAIWGAGIMTIVYLIFKNRFFISPINSFIASLIPGFSFGMWFFSVNVEVYMPPLFCIILALYFITKKDSTKKDFYYAIALHAFAILFHQMNFLFTPVLLSVVWRNRKKWGLVKPFLQYAFLGGASVICVYFIVGWFLLGLHSGPELMGWLEGHANSEGYIFPFSMSTFFNACVGFSRSIIGAHFIFKIDFLDNFINKDFFYHNLTDELFLVQQISATGALVLTLISSFVIALILFLLFYFLKNVKKIFRNDSRAIISSLVLTFFLYSSFSFFFMPQNVELWITQMLTFWIILIGPYLSSIKASFFKVNLVVVFLSLFIIVLNFWGSIKWLCDFKNDYFYVRTEEVLRNVKKNDAILLQDKGPLKSYLLRYSTNEIVLLPMQGDTDAMKKTDSLLSYKQTIVVCPDKTFMHGIDNKPYIDSLFRNHVADTVKEALNPVIILK